MFAVDTGTVMRGNIVAAGTIKLDGWLEGDIVCTRLEIGPNGYLLGRATAREVWVDGQIVGGIAANGVHLSPSAFIEGEVLHGRLSVDPGATLSGKARRIQDVAMPAEYLALETRAANEHAALDRVERESLKAAADRAVIDHPRYQAVREKVMAARSR